MKKLISIHCLIFPLIIVAQSYPQTKSQSDDAVLSSYDKSILSVYNNVKNSTKFNNSFIDITPKSTDCTKKPSLDEIKLGPFYYTDKFYSLKQAYKLGITIANLDFSKNISVLRSGLYAKNYM